MCLKPKKTEKIFSIKIEKCQDVWKNCIILKFLSGRLRNCQDVWDGGVVEREAYSLQYLCSPAIPTFYTHNPLKGYILEYDLQILGKKLPQKVVLMKKPLHRPIFQYDRTTLKKRNQANSVAFQSYTRQTIWNKEFQK